ncbi:DUF1836 domain-containing protein [Clostridium sp. Ade.TY]|uniref:DUF1836 domain-containing protein n=1 Tax=Clostridium sp. Ade.TY TaxID=1391647 RepID=UPI0004062CF3|nr:DUF1836 domain-containing protein [Clostridium sp. Ade.TY]
MKNKELNELIDELHLENNIKLDEIPEIDLYMDQVIQLFEGKYNEAKRNEEDKVLTKTMINNYAKGKLLMPIKNKKYSKEHLILMSLIYNLKGALSLSDIKSSVNNIVENFDNEEKCHLREIYRNYLNQYNNDIESFKEDALIKEKSIKEEVKEDNDFEEKFLLLCSMVNMSNMYRRLSEKLIDEFFCEGDSDK